MNNDAQLTTSWYLLRNACMNGYEQTLCLLLLFTAHSFINEAPDVCVYPRVFTVMHCMFKREHVIKVE